MGTNFYSTEFTPNFYSEEEILKFYAITARRHLKLKKLFSEYFITSEGQQSEMCNTVGIVAIPTQSDSKKQ